MRASWKRPVVKPIQGAAASVVFVGDSITFSWPELSGRSGAVNRGVPAETTRQILARFEAQVLAAGAEGVHILAGVNDIAGNGGEISIEETRHNLCAMADLGKAAGRRVWLASVLPVDGVFWAPAVARPEAKIVELNRGLEADARTLDVAYVDYHRALSTAAGRLRPKFSADGVHLSAAGYAAVTRLAFAALGWA